MPYGERKGKHAPGEYSVVDRFGFGIAAAFGIAVATFVDLTQSDEASALFVLNKWLAEATQMLGLGPIPLYGVVLILMGIGALSILYFQPVTFRGAFVQGFGVLAALMTMAPSDLGMPLPGTNGDLPTADFIDDLPPAGDGGEMMEMEEPDPVLEDDISFKPGLAPNLAVPTALQPDRNRTGYSVQIKIDFPRGLPDDPTMMVRRGDLRGRLYVESNGNDYSMFRTSGGELDFRNNSLYIATTLPGSNPTTLLRARVEAEGYRIADESFEAKRGANPTWRIRMVPDDTPLWRQRLTRPYTF